VADHSFILKDKKVKNGQIFTFFQDAPTTLFSGMVSCSAPFLESSREDLSKDMTDHWFIFKKKVKKAKFRFVFVQNAPLSFFSRFDYCLAARVGK